MLMINSSLASVFSYLLRLLLARTLSIEEFGLYYAVFTFLSFFMFFRSFGLDSALVKYIAEFEVKKEYNKIKTAIASALLFQLVSSIIFIGILFFLSNFLAATYFKNPMASSLMKILILYVPFSMLYLFLMDILQGFQRIKVLSFVNPVLKFLFLLLTFIFFKLNYNIFSPALALVIGSGLMFLLLIPFASKSFNFFKYKITNFKFITKKLFLFGLPVVMVTFGGIIISYVDTLLLIYFRTMTEVGIYNVALPTATIFLFLAGGLSTVLFPMASELWARKEKQKLSDGITLLYKYSFLLLIPFMLSVFSFAKLFIRILFGQEFVSGALSLQILLIGTLFYIVATINNTIISGIGKPKVVTKTILFAAGANFVLNLILIPFFGIEGAAFATTLSYLFVLIVSTIKLKQFIKLQSPWKSWCYTFICGAIFVGVINILKRVLVMNEWLELILAVTISVSVYILLIFVFKLVDLKEIKKYAKLI